MPKIKAMKSLILWGRESVAFLKSETEDVLGCYSAESEGSLSESMCWFPYTPPRIGSQRLCTKIQLHRLYSFSHVGVRKPHYHRLFAIFPVYC